MVISTEKENKNFRFSFSSSAWILILSNLYPLIGILFLDWKTLQIGLVYAAEVLVIIFYSCLKALIEANYFVREVQKRKRTNHFLYLVKSNFINIVIFLTYAILFVSAYAILYSYLYDFLPQVLPDNKYLEVFQRTSSFIDFKTIRIPIIALFISHGFSFVANFIIKKEYRINSFRLGDFIVSRYIMALIFVMPFIFLFNWAYEANPSNFWIVIFLIIKILFDLIRHGFEHLARS